MSPLLVGAVILVFLMVFIRTELGLYLVILSMLLSPEISPTGGIAGRGDVVFRAEDFLLIIISISWFAKTSVNKDVGLVAKTPLNRAIVFYALSALLATLVGYLLGTVRSAGAFLYVLKYVEYFVVYYMVVNNVSDRRQAWRLIMVAFATAAIVSLIGMAQIPGGGRVSAPFEGEVGEPNTFGGYLLLLMAIASGIALETSRIRVRAAAAALTGLMFMPFLFTLSRASYVGLIPAVGVLAALSSRRRIVMPLLALLLVASPVLWTLAPAPVAKRVAYTFKPERRHPTAQIGNVAFDPSTSARFVAFKDAFDGWTTRPILGWGVTGFFFMDSQYARALVETGIIGFAAFLWLAFAVLRSSYASFRGAHDGEHRGLALGFLAGTAGLLFHAIGSNTFIIVRIMEPFWLFAALVVILPTLPGERAPVTAPVRPVGLGPAARPVRLWPSLR